MLDFLFKRYSALSSNVGTMRCTAYVPTYQNSTDLSAVLRIVRVSKSAFYYSLKKLNKMLQRNHKAKRLDTGRWIEGFYSSWTDSKGNGNHQIRSTNGYQNDVDFTTASQSIGLLDIEENRIYENDIVEFTYCPQSLNQKIIGQIARDQWGHPVIADGKALYHIENATKGKIIGNIFDNPELLQTVF